MVRCHAVEMRMDLLISRELGEADLLKIWPLCLKPLGGSLRGEFWTIGVIRAIVTQP